MKRFDNEPNDLKRNLRPFEAKTNLGVDRILFNNRNRTRRPFDSEHKWLGSNARVQNFPTVFPVRGVSGQRPPRHSVHPRKHGSPTVGNCHCQKLLLCYHSKPSPSSSQLKTQLPSHIQSKECRYLSFFKGHFQGEIPIQVLTNFKLPLKLFGTSSTFNQKIFEKRGVECVEADFSKNLNLIEKGNYEIH